ncbi:MAG: hypothetical protein KDJ17_07025 [Hyphomicrobiaceae bacterium]|nr:hypothetical protein [Hyphomicrobiaceae bacterium]
MNAPTTIDIRETLRQASEDEVWAKGHIVPGTDPAILRKDDYGWWIRRSELNNGSSQQGWCVGLILPAHLGGRNVARNMRPLNMSNVNASDWMEDIKIRA